MEKEGQRVFWIVTLVFVMVSAAYGVEVNVDFDPSVDFSRFKTIGWQEGTPAEDEELERRIHAAIERELIPLGIREVREEPDLLIVTHAAMDVSRAIEVSQFDYWLEYQGWNKPMGVSEEIWEAGMGVLVIDLLDASSGRLIWRGIATGNVAKDPEKRGKKLDATMAKLFKGFPPRFKPEK